MQLLTARFKFKKEKLADFEASRDKVLLELRQEQPKGIRYTWWKLPVGVSFLGLLEIEEGVHNPLPRLIAGKNFWRTSTTGLPSRLLGRR